MGKHKKDKKKGAESTVADAGELERLRQENRELRSRLEQILNLATLRAEPDDEDDEYDELTRDVDDLIADDQKPKVHVTEL